jgi:hypothetical protein
MSGVCFLPAIDDLSKLAGIETGLISCRLHPLDLRHCLCHDGEVLVLLTLDKRIMYRCFGRIEVCKRDVSEGFLIRSIG